MESDLPALLRQAEVKVMLDNAMLTRNAVDDPMQSLEAERQIRMAMYKSALGQITEQENRQILDILRPCCPEIFFTPPSIDERQKEFTALRNDLIEEE